MIRIRCRAWQLVAAGTMALSLGAAEARAELELKIIAPAAAGGGWDSTARSMQEVLTGIGAVRSVQVINVPGAGGTVGLAQFVNEAKGDGTRLMVGGMVMVGAILTNKAPVSLDQVTPLARLTGDPLVIVVPKDSPLQTAADLAAAVKSDTAGTIWAGGSAGGTDHILAGLFAKAAGADPAKINYVPFSGGGEALAAILGGRVTAGISGYSEFAGQIEAGELRALAVSTAERVPGVDVPTLKEQGIDIDVVNWRGVFAGPDLAEEDKAALAAAIDQMAKSEAWQKILAAKGWSDFYMPSEEFAPFIAEENERIGGILRSVGLVQ
ncbi:MAG TPA: tripartite tricarboxylate transporter substrate binding protein [Paracoccaceae bacterium]|nr:tripartite tricarboxylate transporter substrate binding protein [Paracoccaceae bacterium]